MKLARKSKRLGKVAKRKRRIKRKENQKKGNKVVTKMYENSDYCIYLYFIKFPML